MYAQYLVGNGVTTILPNMDFETFSEAGYKQVAGKWVSVAGKGKQGGINVTGAWVYSEHPSTTVEFLSYDLMDGRGTQYWLPGMPPPQDLFDHLAKGGLIEAHNSFFEFAIWMNVCVKKMGWPPIRLDQMRDSAAKAGAFSLPRALDKGAKIMGTAPKDAEGHRVMLKLMRPRNPTKKNPDTKWTPEKAPEDFQKLYAYGIQDSVAEADLSAHIPDLTPYELEVWKLDQKINARGLHVDRPLVDAAIDILHKATFKYTTELVHLTGGAVHAGSEVEALRGWMGAWGCAPPTMEAESLRTIMAYEFTPPVVRRVCELRLMLGSASVKKVFAMLARMSSDNRIRDMFMYCAAGRTGRWGGAGVQPHNMPKDGPAICERS